MRRRERHIVNGALIGIGVGTFLDVFLQWLEHRDKGTEFTWENYNGWRTIKTAAVSGAAGAGIGYLVYEYKISEEAKFPFCPDEYLNRVVTEEHLKVDPTHFDVVIRYRQKLKQWLTEKFGNKLVGMPEDAGSFYKRTAIRSNYDLDIVLPFKRKSYGSLEAMYYDVFDAVEEKFSSYAIVTEQTKAIGITFEEDGIPIHFDIVPGREIGDYRTEKDLNLYVKPNSFWQRGSSFKTNIDAQKSMTGNKPEARTIIKLLKAYRDRNELGIPTVVIEQCVVVALSKSKYGIHPSTTENLLNCMSHIAQVLGNNCIVDIANSNNNLLDKIGEMHRRFVSNLLLSDVTRIKDNPRYIREVFEL